jgi:hypothetical protein
MAPLVDFCNPRSLGRSQVIVLLLVSWQHHRFDANLFFFFLQACQPLICELPHELKLHHTTSCGTQQPGAYSTSPQFVDSSVEFLKARRFPAPSIGNVLAHLEHLAR